MPFDPNQPVDPQLNAPDDTTYMEPGRNPTGDDENADGLTPNVRNRYTANAGAKSWEEYFRSNLGNYTPLPGYQTQQQDEARRKQQEIIQDLQLQASGSLDTRAQRELTANNKMGQQSQYAIASGQKGGDMRGATRNAGQVAAQLGGQRSVLGLQEQQSSQQLLAQMLAQQQGQDIASAQGQADHTLKGRALEDAWNQFMAEQQMRAGIDREQIQSDTTRANYGLDLENVNLWSGLPKKVSQAAGTGIEVARRAYDQPPKSSQQEIDDAFNGE